MRIVVAMSGGVDSSVAAALLAEQGHDVIGVSMQLYDNSARTESGGRAFGTCCTIDDLYDARRVAATIGIAHHFESQFGEHVILTVRENARADADSCSHCNSDLVRQLLIARRPRRLLPTGLRGSTTPPASPCRGADSRLNVFPFR
jgi:tRNA-specific 2-thiouridylase